MKKMCMAILLALAFSGCATSEEDVDKPGVGDYIKQLAGTVTAGEHLSPEQAELDREARSMQAGAPLMQDGSAQ